MSLPVGDSTNLVLAAQAEDAPLTRRRTVFQTEVRRRFARNFDVQTSVGPLHAGH